MKIAYIGDWHPTKGTYYRQRITVTQKEYDMINERMVERYRRTQKDIKEAGIMTSQLYMIAAAIFGMPEYEKAHKRITNNNTILMIKG